MVYEWLNADGPNAVERLLGPDPFTSDVWTIRIYDPKAQPIRRDAAELRNSLLTGGARALSQDPFAYLSRPESDITEKHRAHRDKAWNLLAPLVENQTGTMFNYHSRNSPVPALAAKMGRAESTVYRKLRKFFQRGQTKNSQLPDFEKCGWRDRAEAEKRKKSHRKNTNGRLRNSDGPVSSVRRPANRWESTSQISYTNSLGRNQIVL